MYLDDLMLAAPLENQLLQDLSTTLWLFTALGFIVNIPKSVTVPTQCLEFSGICDKYTNRDYRSTTTEDPLNSEGGKAPVVLRCSPNEDPSIFHWHPGSYKTSSTNGGFTLSCVTRPQDKDTPPILILSDDGADHQRCPGRPTMVGNSAAHMLLFSNSEARGQDRDRVRCLKFRLGCSLSRGENRGEVDTTGSTTTHQLFRVEGSFPSFTILSENQQWDKCSHQVRQPHSHCLHKQDGSSYNDTTLLISTTDLAVVSGSADYPSCRISGREGEYNCRLGISPSRQQRLAAFTLHLRWNQQFTRSIQLGPFCQQNECTAAGLLQLEAGRGFQSGLQNYSYNPGEQIHTQLTTQPGLSGVAGVIRDKFIPFQHL